MSQGYPKYIVLLNCELAKSSFYYKPTGGKAGRENYAIICNEFGEIIDKKVVISEIILLFEKPFVDYGYYKVFVYLNKFRSIRISKHLTYKIMKDNELLRNKYLPSSKKNKRKWVTELVPDPDIAFSFFEFDIKFVWVAGKRKNMMVFTVLDVYSRWNIGQIVSFNIKFGDIIKLFKQIFIDYNLPKKIMVRNDNGSQFIATELQNYFAEMPGVQQEFTKPATPQQNAHIESYHSIMESAFCQRVELKNIEEGRKQMECFREFYNFERIHGGIGFTSPYKYLLQKGIDMKINPLNEVESGFLKQN